MEYDSVDDLREPLEDDSLLSVMSGTDGDTYMPHRDAYIDADEYLQTVLDIQFDEDFGAPYWREMMQEELDFDPREEIESYDDLNMLPEADEEELKARSVDDFMPRLFYEENGDELEPDPKYFEMSKSSGTTGKKKEIPWRKAVSEELVSWYNHALNQVDSGSGDWLSVGPYGLWENHHDRFTEERGAINHYTGIEPKGLKKELQAVGSIKENPLSLLRPSIAYNFVRGRVRRGPTMSAIEGDLASEPIENISSAPPLVESLYRALEEEWSVSSPEDIDTLLIGGTAVTEESVERLDDLYDNADLVAMYATSFTGPAFSVDPLKDLNYEPLDPFMRFDVIENDGETVEYGDRGQVMFHRVAEGFFWPNQKERETAVRVEPGDISDGDAIADIKPR